MIVMQLRLAGRWRKGEGGGEAGRQTGRQRGKDPWPRVVVEVVVVGTVV